MLNSLFAAALGGGVVFTPSERDALERLEERVRDVRRGTVLLRENEPATEMFIVRDGMLMSYVLLDDGSRQILRFFYPGDLIGMSSAIYRHAPETVSALTDCVVAPFDKAMLSTAFTAHPRLAALVLASSQVERTALTDRLAALGRNSAKSRVAALLLDLRDRRRMIDPAVTDTFVLGLTQEEVGDATGLTAVHVNRMLRQLEDEGMIAREGGRVTLRDEAALARTGNYVNRFNGVDLSWLPAGR